VLMQHRFSEKLISQCISVFKEKNGVDISPETANEYLNSFADLYLAFAGVRPVEPTL